MDAASSETTSLSRHGSSKVDGLLPPPHSSRYSKDDFLQKVKYPGVSIQRMYKTRKRILADSFEWATTQENFHIRHGQCVSRPRKDEVMGNSSWERSQNKLTLPFKNRVPTMAERDCGSVNPICASLELGRHSYMKSKLMMRQGLHQLRV